jgi:hypothetical protein
MGKNWEKDNEIELINIFMNDSCKGGSNVPLLNRALIPLKIKQIQY